MRWPEVREVEDPASQAVAFYEDGKLIVEVDQKLKGRERSRAIWTAIRAHEGRLPALLPLLLLVGWEPVQRWLRDHAAAAAMAGTAAAGSVTLLLAPLAFEQEDPPRLAAPTATITVTVPTPDSGPPTTGSPTPAKSAPPSDTLIRGEEEPATSERREPAAASPTEASRTTSGPTRSPTRRASTPPPSVSEVTTPPPQGSDGLATPVERRTVEQDPVAPVVEPTVAPRPEPTPASAGRDCLLRVDLSPLADACVLG